MKKFNILSIVAVLAVVISLTSCSKELETTFNDDVKDPNAMIFAAGVSQQILDSDSEPQTRSNPLEDGAASAVFNDGDVVAIMKSGNSYASFAKYMYSVSTNSWEFQATSTTDPIPTTIEEKWNDEYAPTPYWGAEESTFVWAAESETWNFNAYYPVNETTSIDSFLLPADQTTVEKVESADYMSLGFYELARPGHNTVNLNLERKTSRVIVEIVKNERDGLTINKDTKVQILSGSKGYKPDYWGPGSDFINEELLVTPYYSETEAADGTLNPTYTALVLPDDYHYTSKPFCYFTDSGIILFRDATMEFYPGFSYHFKVTITAEAGYQWSMTVQPWTSKTVVEGDLPVQTYYIYDEQDLWEFSQLVVKGHTDITGYLMDNIDMTSITEWSSIGTSTYPFKGVFKGVASESATDVPMMRRIKGLKSDDRGLFGYVGSAEISNITLEEVTIDSGYDDEVGAFIGEISDTKIDNCVVYTGGTVIADNVVGGVIGNIKSGHITISDTLGEQTITLAGDQIGIVQGDQQVGGIIGAIGGAGSATISKVANTASVTAAKIHATRKDGENIGGLIGYIAPDNRTDGKITRISESYNNANVSGGSLMIGGLIGRNESASLILEGCHNAGTVEGTTEQVGGLVGSNAGTIIASYNVGKVEHTGTAKPSSDADALIYSSKLGGLAGNLSTTGKIIGCFNAGDVLIKNATPTPGHGEYSTTSHYGYRGDGVVGTADPGATVTDCYFMRGNADETVGMKNFAMTAPALSWYSKGDTQDIFMYHRMIKSIDKFYDDANYGGTRYAFFPIQPEGTGSSTLTREDMQKIPYTGTYTVDDPLSDIRKSWDTDSTIRPLANAQKYTIQNVVNVINPTDAGMLVSALSFTGITEDEVLKDKLAVAYSYFYVDVKLHIDIDFSDPKFTGFDARVTGAYFGIFDGGEETLLNYTDTKPFFSKISTSDAGVNSKYIGTFKNVIFENPEVTGGGDNLGALLGEADFGTVLANCYVYGGKIIGGTNVGSLIGKSEANILNCHVSGTNVEGATNVGGIVGLIELTKSGTQEGELIGYTGVLPFGGSTTSAFVVATNPNGVAGGIAGKASSDMDSPDFNVESQGVSFKGTVKGNIVGAIAGQIEMAQTTLGFHGVENAGTIIATGENPTIGGLVGIGRIIGGGSLQNPSYTPSITSLNVYAIAVSNRGAIDPISSSSGIPKIGGMVGELRLNGAPITAVTTSVDGAYETISVGSAFVPFIGNKSDMPNLTETFGATYLSSMPTDYDPNPFVLLPAKGTEDFNTAMGIINTHLSTKPVPFLYNSRFTYNSDGELVFPPLK